MTLIAGNPPKGGVSKPAFRNFGYAELDPLVFVPDLPMGGPDSAYPNFLNAGYGNPPMCGVKPPMGGWKPPMGGFGVSYDQLHRQKQMT